MSLIDKPENQKFSINPGLPAATATQKKTAEKLKIHKQLITVADEFVKKLPQMKVFVNKKLAEIKNNAAFGSNIADGGIGDWLSADKVLTTAANVEKGLKALLSKAKDVLSSLVKKSTTLGLFANDTAYFEGEKICYFADKEFVELDRMLKGLAEKERWLKRKGLIFDLTESSGATTLKRN